MTITIDLGSRGKRWELDLSTPPVERIQRGSRVFGVFLVVFALLWGGIPVMGLVSEVQAGRFGVESLLFLIFPTIGVGVLLFGIHSLMWRRRIAFDGSAFTVAEHGLKGTRQWSEPVSAYHGVLRHTRRVRTKNRSYTVYLIDLVHPDEDRKINLYTSTKEGGFREKWEQFARDVGLPALEEGEAGIVRREAEDLDKSVGDLIGEGKVAIDREVLSRPPTGLAVGYEGDVVVLTRTGPTSAWWGSVLAVLFPLIFVGVAVYAPNVPATARYLFGGIGALFEIVFMIGVLTDLLSRQRLRIGPAGVWVNRAYRHSESKGRRIEADRIETVTIARKSDASRPALAIASDHETLTFGNGLPRRALEFAMNTVLAKIAETRRRR